MKPIFTHLLAFILGILILPVVVICTFSIAPNTIPTLLESAISCSVPKDRGIAALNKAKTEEERFYALGDAAKQAFEKADYINAKAYAVELAALAPKYKGNWNYGNAIQDSNVILGRIDVREGKIEDAKKHLIDAGKSPGSPQMDSFGPNVSLAKDLLEKGEKEVVIEYFTLCKKFWEMQGGKLDNWITLARSGRIPDFGANLLY